MFQYLVQCIVSAAIFSLIFKKERDMVLPPIKDSLKISNILNEKATRNDITTVLKI